MRTYDSVRKIATGQDDSTTGSLMDFNYFNKHYKMIFIYLSKQQALDTDPKAIQQTNFTGNIDRPEGTTLFFTIKKAKKKKKNCFRFFIRNCEAVVNRQTWCTFLGNKVISKNLYHETFLSYF